MHFSIAKNDYEKPKIKRHCQLDLHLTERDFEIFKFVLDMKFASREAIAEKFFWSKDQKSDSRSIFSTRNRLQKLKVYDWLVPVQFPGNAKHFYQASWKAYYEIRKRYPSETIPKPQGKPDYETAQHDLMVLNSRIHLEKEFKIKVWVSDKTIRTITGDLKFGADDFSIPDGLYLSHTGEKTAFELERVQKSKTQYREKLKSLVRTLRSGRNHMLDFSKVHFVCLTDAGFKFLKEETKIYGDLFKIEKAADFFNSKLITKES